jgi:hypothetical protein
MSNASFLHRDRPDGTRDSFCLNCYVRVHGGRDSDDAEFEQAESGHQCNVHGNDVLENALRLMAGA